jgi:hypothetical protein
MSIHPPTSERYLTDSQGYDRRDARNSAGARVGVFGKANTA